MAINILPPQLPVNGISFFHGSRGKDKVPLAVFWKRDIPEARVILHRGPDSRECNLSTGHFSLAHAAVLPNRHARFLFKENGTVFVKGHGDECRTFLLSGQADKQKARAVTDEVGVSQGDTLILGQYSSGQDMNSQSLLILTIRLLYTSPPVANYAAIYGTPGYMMQPLLSSTRPDSPYRETDSDGRRERKWEKDYIDSWKLILQC